MTLDAAARRLVVREELAFVRVVVTGRAVLSFPRDVDRLVAMFVTARTFESCVRLRQREASRGVQFGGQARVAEGTLFRSVTMRTRCLGRNRKLVRNPVEKALPVRVTVTS